MVKCFWISYFEATRSTIENADRSIPNSDFWKILSKHGKKEKKVHCCMKTLSLYLRLNDSWWVLVVKGACSRAAEDPEDLNTLERLNENTGKGQIRIFLNGQNSLDFREFYLIYCQLM